jgi:hypothetical protein
MSIYTFNAICHTYCKSWRKHFWVTLLVLDTVVVLWQLDMFKLKGFVLYDVPIHATYIYSIKW